LLLYDEKLFPKAGNIFFPVWEQKRVGEQRKIEQLKNFTRFWLCFLNHDMGESVGESLGELQGECLLLLTSLLSVY
jgi:hypothetical protein